MLWARHKINKCYIHSTCVISCQFVCPLSLGVFSSGLVPFPPDSLAVCIAKGIAVLEGSTKLSSVI